VSATIAPDLNDIGVFVRVIEDGSFSGAARALGLPTSTVSRRVARLEAALGARLLHRTTRKLSLTAAGRLYFERSARIIAELAEAELAVSELGSSPRGLVRGTAPVSVAGIDRLVTDFLVRYPDVQIEMDLTNRTVNLVAEGYDMAIRAGDIGDSSLIAHRLADSHLLLVASPAYLRRRGTPRTPKDLRDHDAVIYARWPSSQESWTLRGPRGPIRVPVRGRIIANHWSVLKQAALAGLGIALMPDVYCLQELESGRLKAVLPKSTPAMGGVYVVIPSRRHLSPAVRAWVDFVKTNYDRYM
jgi:DNA-binding transcriptional LysR family regulator